MLKYIFNHYLFFLVIFAIHKPPLYSSILNDNTSPFILRTSIGYGQARWGYINNTDKIRDAGKGTSSSIEINMLKAFKMFCIETTFFYSSIEDLQWIETDDLGTKHTIKTTGYGHFTIFDFKTGLKLFNSSNDMGYTFVYGGFRFWSGSRTRETIEDNNVLTEKIFQTKSRGYGWIAGLRDISTYGESTALLLHSEIFGGKAPIKHFESSKKSYHLENKSNYCIGVKFGVGVALQEQGFSALLAFKNDYIFNSFENSENPGYSKAMFVCGISHLQAEISQVF